METERKCSQSERQCTKAKRPPESLFDAGWGGGAGAAATERCIREDAASERARRWWQRSF